MPPLPDAGQIQSRLVEIDTDIQTRIPELEKAAEELFFSKRDFEVDEGKCFLAAEGTVAERHAKAAVALEGCESFKNLKVAEGVYEGRKRALAALETRAAIGMSMLKVAAREAGYGN